MRWQDKLAVAVVSTIAGFESAPVQAQGVGKYFAPADQVIAIRAGRLFDAKSGSMLTNQVVLLKGDRITEVGAAVPIPAGARVLDLGAAAVLPGMIDAHVHVNTGGSNLPQRTLRGLGNALIDLEAGFTTVLDMDSRGGFYTVDLRDAINAGIVPGPRMQVVGQSLNQRATNYYPDTETRRYYEGFTENKNVNGPWLARTAVREAKLHGVDYLKIYTTQIAGTTPCGSPTERWSTARHRRGRKSTRSSRRRTGSTEVAATPMAATG
jgi:imidazolonepropionase-like amidohydrolase